jgi:hypothetical protein
LVFKIYFEKAFDKIEHNTIMQILRAKGFGERRIKWIEFILSSGTSVVLLNDIPEKKFYCRKGVRQGDPLPLLLFVLATDLLQSILNKAMNQGLLTHTIPSPCPDFPSYSMEMILWWS